jgi:gamma-glutamylcyclotransferase (GGCT)/AIG2-like uncharacterized protein YtfP
MNPPACADSTLVFVYGTLKRGGSNHHYLAGQTLIGTARTVAGFTLYSLGDYPGLVAEATAAEGVSGEIWAVDAACLASLDILEGIDEGLYAREPAPLAPPHDGLKRVVQFYRYLGPVQDRARLGAVWAV